MPHLPALHRLTAPALALLLLAGCTGTSASTSEPAPVDAPSAAETTATPELRGERVVVERVIDGDTVDVRKEGEVVRVRLLNIDTPETKDPNELVECLGPEATALLEQLLPPGTVVGLEYDQERTDPYGRTLAGVFLEDGALVNAEIARVGLGTPMHIAPNDRFLPPVEEAFAEAKQKKAGLLDPAVGCALPAQVKQASSALAGASPEDLADSASKAAAAAALLVSLDRIDRDAHPHIGHLLTTVPVRGAVSELRSGVANLKERAEKQRRKAATEAAQKASTPDSGPQAPPAPSAPDPAPVAPAPVVPDLPKLPKVELPPVPAPLVPAPPVPAPAPKPAPNPGANIVNEAPPGYYADLPGYTGPRCYAPGGKLFKPC